LRLPLKSGVLDLVENIDKESRNEGQAGACAMYAGIQAGGSATGARGPGHWDRGQGTGYSKTKGQPGELGARAEAKSEFSGVTGGDKAVIRAIHTEVQGEYGWPRMHKELLARGMRSSMSRKGNCWDSAPTESFWGRLKTASLYGRKFATRREAIDLVLDWMVFYNHRRLHSSLGYLSPMQYEQRWYEAQRKKAAQTMG